MILDWFKRKFGHPDAPNLYSYHMGPIFTNGAQESVFNQEFSLPPILARGASRNAGMLDVLQPAQLRVQLAVPVAGIGGQQAGQVILQPLQHEENLGVVQ